MSELINDIELESTLMEKEKSRFEHFIPNFLMNYIQKGDKICSVGCGIGYDVELFDKLGYDCYGFDPGNRVKKWQELDLSVTKKLKVGRAEDIPFDYESFDFMYALEVIEHVGCKDGYWELENDYLAMRISFLESCLRMLKNNGKLMISTSNRFFPIDFGHGHHYSKLTNIFAKLGIRLTIPWHKKNFVVSYSDMKKMLKNSVFKDQFVIYQHSTTNYPQTTSKGLKGKIARVFLNFFSSYPLIRFNPILVVTITKLGNPIKNR